MNTWQKPYCGNNSQFYVSMKRYNRINNNKNGINNNNNIKEKENNNLCVYEEVRLVANMYICLRD